MRNLTPEVKIFTFNTIAISKMVLQSFIATAQKNKTLCNDYKA